MLVNVVDQVCYLINHCVTQHNIQLTLVCRELRCYRWYTADTAISNPHGCLLVIKVHPFFSLACREGLGNRSGSFRRTNERTLIKLLSEGQVRNSMLEREDRAWFSKCPKGKGLRPYEDVASFPGPT